MDKRNLIKLMIPALFIAMASFSGCEKENTEQLDATVVVPTTEFVLESCYWDWDNISIDTLYVINSNEKLANYTKCDNDFPEIDFSRQTLLVVHGGTSNTNTVTSKLKYNGEEYTLDVDINVGNFCYPQRWYVILSTDKLPTDYVELNLMYHY
ncbi:MAG: hypothetical protein FWD66_07180 [Paludibacter sp.]|nr:hypothetical protein [Paludibacter sp.]